MAATLSALITYHNEKGLLREALESVLRQERRPDEVLVYDDASAYPAEDYIPKDWSVRVIRGPINRGLGFARNRLMEESSCEYVHYHDADDLFHPDWCRRVRALVDRTRPDIVITEIRSFCDKGMLCDAVLGLNRLADIGDLVRFGLLGSILAPATTFRRELGLKIGGFRLREKLPFSEDGDFHIRLAAASSSHEAILDPLVLQRIRHDSLSRNQGLARLECFTSGLITIRSLSGLLNARYRPDLAEAAARLGSILFRAGDRPHAKEAFYLARELGAHFRLQKPWYRAAARTLGQERAEHLGLIYRKAIPERIRGLLHDLSDAFSREALL
jgi:glycosyltransferase involved in cell wall biosynthesis